MNIVNIAFIDMDKPDYDVLLQQLYDGMSYHYGIYKTLASRFKQ